MRKRSFLLGALIVSLLADPSSVRADDEVVAHLASETGLPYSYAEYLPPGYDTEADDAFHPLVVFMHGSGERAPLAADAARVINRASVHGPFSQIEDGERRFADASAIVLAPIAPSEDGWWNDGKLQTFLAYVVAHYRIDWRRVYITGVSMGGGGTFTVGNRHRARAAAYIPICPAGQANGASYTDVPLWAFHAIGDGTVTVDNTWTSMDRIADARAGSDVAGLAASYPRDGADHTAVFDVAANAFTWVPGRDGSGSSPLRATLYPDGSHNSWTRTYDDPAVWTWLFAQRRSLPDGLPEETRFVDAVHPGVVLEGAWTRRDDRAGFFFWDLATATAGEGVSATFPLRATEDGLHEIYLRHVAVPDAGMAEITITHDDGDVTTTIDLSMGGGAFVSLGTFPIRTSSDATLRMRGAPGDDGLLVADAIAVVRRGALPTPDAGVAPDGGIAIGDAGPENDSGPARDAGAARDAGPRADAGAGPMLVGTCGCTASAPQPAPWTTLTILGALALLRSRRTT
jgi:MYXO-CTERM domain-containing protein